MNENEILRIIVSYDLKNTDLSFDAYDRLSLNSCQKTELVDIINHFEIEIFKFLNKNFGVEE